MEIYENGEGKTELLLGNKAIARGAIEAGVDVAASYPGTPASEIMETLAESSSELDIYTEWSTNEKVAFELGVGASITGVRSLVSMKHAGMNWVMDPFMTIVYGGIRGGFVTVVADDPGAHYSSNEQDTRILAEYAEIPCFEPANQQEAKDMTKYSFKLSEKIELPIYIRSVTRISHSLGNVTLGKINKEKREPVFDRHYKHPYRWNVYGNTGPVKRHKWLKDRKSLIDEETKDLPWDQLEIPDSPKLGVISSGIGSSYTRESLDLLDLENKIAFLKIGTAYPIPEKKVEKLLQKVEKVLVVEEGTEFIERKTKEIAKNKSAHVEIYGRLTGHIPEVGEINPDVVTDGLSKLIDIKPPKEKINPKAVKKIKDLVVPRSSTFCAGCPHIGTYWALRQVLERLDEDKVQIVNGDIGCYEMAGYGVFGGEIEAGVSEESQKYPINSPYEILDTNYVMGGGIGLMQGQYQAGYEDGPLLAIAGDSTFFHATLPEVVNAVYNGVEGVFIITDNRWTSMTGHHPNPGSGERITGEKTNRLDIGEIIKSLGIENVREADAYDLEKVEKAIRESIEEDGFSVVISKRSCTLEALRRNEFKKIEIQVNPKECISCYNCVELGCPAITYQNETGGINQNLCVGCGLCTQICPTEALTGREEE